MCHFMCIYVYLLTFASRSILFSSGYKSSLNCTHKSPLKNNTILIINPPLDRRKKSNKTRMSFFGIGPSAKLLTVDVTFIHPKRACVVKSYTIGMSGGNLSGDSGATLMHPGGGNIARETLPLITSGE